MRQAGFTLIELMVSLVIFAILAAAGVALLANSVRASDVTGRQLDDSAALRRTMSLMEADFAQAVPRVTRGTDGRATPAMLGTGGSVQLVRDGWENPDAAPRPGEQKLIYRLDGDRLERIGFAQVDGAAPLPAVALLEGVTSVTLRYRSRGAWNGAWPLASTLNNAAPPLPDAVEWTIQRRAGGPVRALFLVGSGSPPPPDLPDTPGNAG